MAKISKDMLRGIKPLPKRVSFKVLDEQDKEKEISFDILPFTVDEKLEIEQIRDEASKHKEGSEEHMALMKSLSEKSIFFIMRKCIEDFQMEDINEFVLPDWIETIYWTAMEFEGITPELKKKIMEESQI